MEVTAVISVCESCPIEPLSLISHCCQNSEMPEFPGVKEAICLPCILSPPFLNKWNAGVLRWTVTFPSFPCIKKWPMRCEETWLGGALRNTLLSDFLSCLLLQNLYCLAPVCDMRKIASHQFKPLSLDLLSSRWSESLTNKTAFAQDQSLEKTPDQDHCLRK